MITKEEEREGEKKTVERPKNKKDTHFHRGGKEGKTQPPKRSYRVPAAICIDLATSPAPSSGSKVLAKKKRYLKKEETQKEEKRRAERTKKEDVPVGSNSFSGGPSSPMVCTSVAISNGCVPPRFYDGGRVTVSCESGTNKIQQSKRSYQPPRSFSASGMIVPFWPF